MRSINVRETEGKNAYLEIELDDGRKAHVLQLLSGTVRLCMLDSEQTYSDGWWYADFVAAVAAMVEWEKSGVAEPSGWFRHPKSGRRRPDSDPSKQYVHR